MRKYSIKEIDRMRVLVQVLYGSGYSLNSDVVENRLRTLMMAGKTSKDLKKRIRKRMEHLKSVDPDGSDLQNMQNDLYWIKYHGDEAF